ncbi:hypothetical protein [Endozoicomonas sp. 4G]|uniref:hypothetical protein n=1 Tax=Endozoicomonas sp. 4G TaxID=2872754 RepID=UPI002078EC4F|nr:hypothetical protein [Endozoicomonas sp. 4G]
MNYQSTDAFARVGLVNSAIESKENRQYRKEMMGMHRVEHDRKIRKEDMLDKVNVLRSLQHLSQSDDPAERQLAQDIFTKASNDKVNEFNRRVKVETQEAT